MKEFQNNLSILMCAFLQPIRETSSVVCWGVNASIAATLPELLYSLKHYRAEKYTAVSLVEIKDGGL